MLPKTEIARIYDEHASSVFGLFLKFARDSDDARDLLQDWLVKIDGIDDGGTIIWRKKTPDPKKGDWVWGIPAEKAPADSEDHRSR